MEAFWLSLGLIFLAELGDKTQLVALLLATRFKAGVVLAGIFVATLAVHALSVALGGATSHILPQGWIYLLSGLAFVGFGWWTWRGDTLEDEADYSNRRFNSPFIIVFITFFLAELGDKTMLSTVTLAASQDLFPVWLGSTLGMVLSDALAIWVGQILGKQLPERAIKIGAAVIFIGFGIYFTMQGVVDLWSLYRHLLV
jgi:putative Ca2+/H+ antiporter (TMEM165/GDT1 family)